MSSRKSKSRGSVVTSIKRPRNPVIEKQDPTMPKLDPSAQPILLHDSNKMLVGGIKLDNISINENVMRLSGWTLGSSRVALLFNNEPVAQLLRRLPRPDVLDALAASTHFDPGFVLTLSNPKRGGVYCLRWYVEMNNRVEAIDFLLDVDLPIVDEEVEQDPVQRLLVDISRGDQPSASLRDDVECVVKVSDGIIIIGWMDHREQKLADIYIHKNKSSPQRFSLPTSGANTQHVYREALCRRLELPRGQYPKFGFVTWIPFDADRLDSISIGFQKDRSSAKSLSVIIPNGQAPELDNVLEHSGFALLRVAEFHNDDRLLNWLDERGYSNRVPDAAPIAAIDHAYVIGGRVLLLNGWIAASTADIQELSLQSGPESLPLKPIMQRVFRPDVSSAYPAMQNESLGFLCLIDDPDFVQTSQMNVMLRTAATRSNLQLMPSHSDFDALFQLLAAAPNLIAPFRLLATGSAAIQSISGFEERLSRFLRSHILTQFNNAPVHVDIPAATITAVDRVYALGEGGVLFYGWRFDPESKPLRVTVTGPDGNEADVTQRFFPVYRVDAAQGLRTRFAKVPDRCGFICHAELPTSPGEARVLRFEFQDNKEVWVKLASTKLSVDGLQQVKDMLAQIPSPDRIRSELFQLFDLAMGKPIEHVYKSRKLPALEPEVREFGTPPVKPAITVIVPLYGRFDFLRHQLAHFAGDPEFDNCDLLYVVDDPSILEATLDSAAYCHDLFGKPFRVAWYDANLGFAGANNIGVRLSRGNILMLLNSDVLPQQAGWLGMLSKELLALPKCGAVGPLLEFGDGSIQHAGMHSRRDPMFPGFLLNSHVQKGLRWSGSDEPRKVPMLTAACLMLRKADFLAAGGLDEGYIIGDFEDSDLCLKLRKLGKEMWLVPAARLWHLERQSQNLNNVAGLRQLLTLFNGWRFHQKITSGSIANPEVSK